MTVLKRNPKVLNEQEKAVAELLRQSGVEYSVSFCGATTRGDAGNGKSWECDSWQLTFSRPLRIDNAKTSGRKQISFEYFTGTAHRKLPKGTRMPDIVKKNPRSVAASNWRFANPELPVEPPAAGVLYSVVLDGSAIGESFADWCANYGYDTDSIKATELYKACQDNYQKLQQLFTREQTKRLEEILQDY